MISLAQFTHDFATGICHADASCDKHPKYGPGLGPHKETKVIDFVMAQLKMRWPERYAAHATGVDYPDTDRECDICLGQPPNWTWAIEAKAVRALRNNGQLEENMFKQLLSPYPPQKTSLGSKKEPAWSALTDASKVLSFRQTAGRAVLLWAFDYPNYPVEPLLDVYEYMLRKRVTILEKREAPFAGLDGKGLKHKHHKFGKVIAWSVAEL